MNVIATDANRVDLHYFVFMLEVYRETISKSAANQPRLRSWPRKLANSAKYCKIMAIMPFKVIQGDRF